MKISLEMLETKFHLDIHVACTIVLAYQCVAGRVFDHLAELFDGVLHRSSLHQTPPTLVMDVTSDLSCDV